MIDVRRLACEAAGTCPPHLYELQLDLRVKSKESQDIQLKKQWKSLLIKQMINLLQLASVKKSRFEYSQKSFHILLCLAD